MVHICHNFFICNAHSIAFFTYLDIDECAKPSICPENFQCENRPGRYECTCKDGYQKSVDSGCEGNFDLSCEITISNLVIRVYNLCHIIQNDLAT